MMLAIWAFGLHLAFWSTSIRAQTYSRGPLKKGEYVSTFVEDVRFPHFATGTYFTFLYTSYENGAPFYSGIVMKGGWRKNVFNIAFWRGGMKGRCECLCTGPTIFCSSTGGEGATGGASGPFPLMKPNEWYTIVYKIWRPEENPRQISYFGLWIKDVKAGQWRRIVTYRLPVLSRGFSSLGGFIEQITTRNQVHEFHRRNSYALVAGKGWRSLNSITVRTHRPTESQVTLWRIRREPDSQSQLVTCSHDEDLLPDHNVPTDGKLHTYSFTQPEHPRFDSFAIRETRVRRCGSQLLISWEMAAGSPPHIAARVEIADASKPGKIVETHHTPTSYQRSLLIDTKVKNPVITLALRSIFDQQARSLPVRSIETVAKPTARATRKKTISGLQYSYYEHKDDITSLADAFRIPATNHGVVHGLDLSVKPAAKRGIAFAMKFSGFINTPAAGFYQFHVRASDGYRLTIAGTSLEYDGVHGLVPKVLTVLLPKGLNPFELEYFNARRGEEMLFLEWVGPGVPFQQCPLKAFRCESDEPETLALRIEPQETPFLKVAVEGVSRKVKSATYYVDDRVWATETTPPVTTHIGIALSGNHDYWARLYFEDGATWATPRRKFVGKNILTAGGDWSYQRGSHAGSPIAYVFDGKKLFVSGMGRHEILRNTRGDFVLKAHIDALEGGGRGAYVALAVHGSTFGIYSTTTHGLCPPTHQRDFTGRKYMSNPLTTKDEPPNPAWICLARRGKTFFTYYSHDGKQWYKANELHDPSRAAKTCRVGIRFETSLAIGSPYLTARVSSIEFQSRFDSTLEPKSKPVEIQLTDRAIVGLIHVEGETILARTMHGLLISFDFGKSWTAFQGDSEEKADGVIRSLAVDPKNSKELFCAEVEKGTSKLLHSTDGGHSWTRIACPVTFSARPENVILGEILAIDKYTDRIVLGGNGGLYVSEDRGRSWSLLGHKGQQITFVRFNPDARPRDPRRQLYTACTSPQSPPLIGGHFKECGESALYVWDLDRKRCLVLSVPAPVLDMRFQLRDKYRWFYIATTRGVFETVNGGRRFLQMYCPEDYSVRRTRTAIWDQPATAFDMFYQSVRQNMMYACRMENTGANTVRVFYMKKAFDARFPPMSDGELVLKLLAHPTDAGKAVVGTTRGAYYCTEDGMRGVFRAATLPAYHRSIDTGDP